MPGEASPPVLISGSQLKQVDLEESKEAAENGQLMKGVSKAGRVQTGSASSQTTPEEMELNEPVVRFHSVRAPRGSEGLKFGVGLHLVRPCTSCRTVTSYCIHDVKLPKAKSVEGSKHEIAITRYEWSQADNALTLYVALRDLEQLGTDSVDLNLTDSTITLKVCYPDGRRYKLYMHRLFSTIDPAGSSFTINTTMKRIVVFLRKAEPGKKWRKLTEFAR